MIDGDKEATCDECGELLDQDCNGQLRCPSCDEPCPHCASGPGPMDYEDENDEDDTYE